MITLSESKKWNERIKFNRINNRKSQQQLANDIGVSLRTIQRWEKGETKPYPKIKEKIAAILNLTVEDIFN
jgi:DNA-binding XRE family transcriptional regulator